MYVCKPAMQCVQIYSGITKSVECLTKEGYYPRLERDFPLFLFRGIQFCYINIYSSIFGNECRVKIEEQTLKQKCKYTHENNF